MKRGHLYFGEPGNGKSSLAAAIGYEYKRHIYFMDINSFQNDEMMKAAFSSIRENSILLIEDIDQVFNGRNPVRKECQVTFSMFINMLSGVLDKDNLITIITTNKKDELDPALLRAGRMDFHCEVLPPDSETVKRYVEVFYDVEEINIIEEGDKLNMPKNFATLEKWCESNMDSHESVVGYINKENELIVEDYEDG
jgi:chaperone BCS1